MDHSALNRLLAGQDQLATRQQLLAHGVSKATIRHRAGRQWRVLLPSVYQMGMDQPTPRRRWIAALLHAGPRSVLAGSTAARWHGLDSAIDETTVRVVVPPPLRPRRTGFVVIRRPMLFDSGVRTVGPVRVSSPARAVVDHARELHGERQRAALFIEAVQKDLASVDELTEWLSRLRTRDAAALWPALEAAATGSWSVPEHDLLELVSTSTVLPEPMMNPILTDEFGRLLVSPDLWWDDVGFAAMVHSKRWHSNGEQWDETVERDGDLVAAGVIVAGVTPRRISDTPGAVLARLEQSYRTAEARPRPPVRAIARAA